MRSLSSRLGLTGKRVHRLQNTMVLTVSLRAAFKKCMLWFEPNDNLDLSSLTLDNVSHVRPTLYVAGTNFKTTILQKAAKLHRYRVRSFIRVGDPPSEVTFKFHADLDPPNPLYLGYHAMAVKVIHLSGAWVPISDVDYAWIRELNK